MLILSNMSLNSEHRWVRALMWLVIICVPGGLLLFAVLAADAVQSRLKARRLSDRRLSPATDLSESGVAKRLGTAGADPGA